MTMLKHLLASLLVFTTITSLQAANATDDVITDGVKLGKFTQD